MNKNRTNAGASLGETLLVIALLLLAGSVIYGGIAAAVSVRQKTMRQENAEILCSTITSRIVEELSGATEFVSLNSTTDSSTTDSSTTENSPSCCFVSRSGTVYDGLRIGFYVNSDGQVMVAYYTKTRDIATDGTVEYTYNKITSTENTSFHTAELFPSATYTDDLKASLSIESNNDLATITVSITYDDDELTSQTVTVALGD